MKTSPQKDDYSEGSDDKDSTISDNDNDNISSDCESIRDQPVDISFGREISPQSDKYGSISPGSEDIYTSYETITAYEESDTSPVPCEILNVLSKETQTTQSENESISTEDTDTIYTNTTSYGESDASLLPDQTENIKGQETSKSQNEQYQNDNYENSESMMTHGSKPVAQVIAGQISNVHLKSKGAEDDEAMMTRDSKPVAQVVAGQISNVHLKSKGAEDDEALMKYDSKPVAQVVAGQISNVHLKSKGAEDDDQAIPDAGQLINVHLKSKGAEDDEEAPDEGQLINVHLKSKGAEDDEEAPDEGQLINVYLKSKGAEDDEEATDEGQLINVYLKSKGAEDDEEAPDEGQMLNYNVHLKSKGAEDDEQAIPDEDNYENNKDEESEPITDQMANINFQLNLKGSDDDEAIPDADIASDDNEDTCSGESIPAEGQTENAILKSKCYDNAYRDVKRYQRDSTYDAEDELSEISCDEPRMDDDYRTYSGMEFRDRKSSICSNSTITDTAGLSRNDSQALSETELTADEDDSEFHESEGSRGSFDTYDTDCSTASQGLRRVGKAVGRRINVLFTKDDVIVMNPADVQMQRQDDVLLEHDQKDDVKIDSSTNNAMQTRDTSSSGVCEADVIEMKQEYLETSPEDGIYNDNKINKMVNKDVAPVTSDVYGPHNQLPGGDIIKNGNIKPDTSANVFQVTEEETFEIISEERNCFVVESSEHTDRSKGNAKDRKETGRQEPHYGNLEDRKLKDEKKKKTKQEKDLQNCRKYNRGIDQNHRADNVKNNAILDTEQPFIEISKSVDKSIANSSTYYPDALDNKSPALSTEKLNLNKQITNQILKNNENNIVPMNDLEVDSRTDKHTQTKSNEDTGNKTVRDMRKQFECDKGETENEKYRGLDKGDGKKEEKHGLSRIWSELFGKGSSPEENKSDYVKKKDELHINDTTGVENTYNRSNQSSNLNVGNLHNMAFEKDNELLRCPSPKNKRSPEIKKRIQRRKEQCDAEPGGRMVDPADRRVPLIQVTAPSTERIWESMDLDAMMSEEDDAYIDAVLKQLEEKKEKKRQRQKELEELEEMEAKRVKSKYIDDDDAEFFKFIEDESFTAKRKDFDILEDFADDDDDYSSFSESIDESFDEPNTHPTIGIVSFYDNDDADMSGDETEEDLDTIDRLSVGNNNHEKRTVRNIQTKLAQIGQSLSIDDMIGWLRTRPVQCPSNKSSNKSSNKLRNHGRRRVVSESSEEDMVGWIRGRNRRCYLSD